MSLGGQNGTPLGKAREKDGRSPTGRRHPSSGFDAAPARRVKEVLEGHVELRNEVAVGGMHLDTIEARRPGALSGGDELGCRLLDARRAHRLGHDGLACYLLHQVRNCRRRDRLRATNVQAGMAAAVSQLYRGFGALSAARARQPRKPGRKRAEFAPAVAPAAFGRGHLHRDKADATAPPRNRRSFAR